MAYESIYESFEVAREDGKTLRAIFKKAGVLAGFDQPELYFFDLQSQGAGEPVIVGILSGALTEWQKSRRYLSREEKIDVAGLFLKRALESGMEGGAGGRKLAIGEAELREMVAALGLTAQR